MAVMAPQGTVRAQIVHTGLRRTVDRVDERFDERFGPPFVEGRTG
ncbi:hypothetical protein QNN03_06425 [Streptomyces sp. GXMU-J15]|uniref:Uncharacterized protein n=1 Tax=Streptomyces fuscus TaxID=3048495 RepID=A0ABT7IU08_9ACTN|nr:MULTISPECIES: hypothetical protein [Streptomyces]MDL2076074.1 hypothetical protein [Streptomyces fuscus]